MPKVIQLAAPVIFPTFAGVAGWPLPLNTTFLKSAGQPFEELDVEDGEGVERVEEVEVVREDVVEGVADEVVEDVVEDVVEGVADEGVGDVVEEVVDSVVEDVEEDVVGDVRVVEIVEDVGTADDVVLE